ncbi:MAG: nitroreductase family protein, partial [Bacteroidales bacterium]|nr:nitroreductase family protein [Bacteroidales bacterium]
MKRLTLIFAVLLCAAGCRQAAQPASVDFLQLATDRYSVRSFDSTAVSDEDINLILRAGQIAPTAVNSQPQKTFVVRSAEMMEKLRSVSPC